MKRLSVALALVMLAALVGVLFPSANEASAFDASSFKIIKVTDENRAEVFATAISSSTTETYNPADRLWNGIPHIEVTAGGRLFAVWYTGGTNEPHDDNYMVLGYSDDGGKSWVDPFIIVDTYDDSIRAFDPFLHINSRGELVWYWWRGSNWQMTVPNPDAAPEDITWSTPVITGPDNLGACIQEPVRLSDGSLAICRQNGYMAKDIDFIVSSDEGRTWRKRGTAISKAEQDSSEARVLELSDGTLWLLGRVPGGAGGGVQRWVSTDSGWSWSEPEYELGAPFIGPGSRFAVEKLASGNIIIVSHNTTSSRTDLTVWMSEDGGKTWPYNMLIDDRTNVSYPELDQAADGTIYLIYDKGRAIEKEIRLSVFNEQDIREGCISSAKGVSRLVVAKDASYNDIVFADTGVSGGVLTVAVGTKKEKIFDMLNEQVAVVSESGEEKLLSGEWKVLGYKQDTCGVYEFYYKYNKSDLPQKTADNRGLLTVKVRLVDKSEQKGCGATVAIVAAVVAVCAAGAAAALVLRKKRSA